MLILFNDSQTAFLLFLRIQEVEITTPDESVEVVAEAAVMKETRDIEVARRRGTGQGRGTRTIIAKDAIEEVSHLLQVIGVPTSAGGTKRKAENAETIEGQDPGLTLT